MSQKRQFKSGAKPRTFFDRKVREEGYTRTVSLGKILPKQWIYVRVQIISQKPDELIVRITKLAEEENSHATSTPS